MTRTVLALSVIFLVLPPARAGACSCVGGIPLCESFWKTDAVFSGMVIDIAPVSTANKEAALPSPTRRVQFQVLQSWRGPVSGIVEVMTGSGGGDCGYRFERGATYLVYASSGVSGLTTGICSRTRLLADASEDLAYLKTASRPAATGRVIGSVRYLKETSTRVMPDRFISGYVVELSDTRRTWKTTSNRDGQFEFTAAAGTYSIRLLTPETEHASGPKTVTLADARGCAAADFYVVPDGRLSVRIVDRAGAPVNGVSIELLDVEAISRDRATFYARTLDSDADGLLEFSRLHPKRYALAINVTRVPSMRRPFAATYFPGVASLAEATTIDLGPGERLDLGQWVLPGSLRERQVAGQVVWPDGKPVAGAGVTVFARTNQPWSSVVDGGGVSTDADGRFTVTIHEGVAYELSAYMNVGQPIVQWNSRRVSIPQSHSGEPIRLELQPPVQR